MSTLVTGLLEPFSVVAHTWYQREAGDILKIIDDTSSLSNQCKLPLLDMQGKNIFEHS